MMSTFPFLKTPTQEYVVPRSMPISELFFASRADTTDAMLKRATGFQRSCENENQSVID